MNYRERFEATLKHKAVDRVPFDLAGTALTGMYGSADRLCQYLGFADKYDGWYTKFDERVLKHLDIDTRRVGDILSPSSRLESRSEGQYTDCWGVTRVFTGMYWDIKISPLKDACINDLDSFPWPRAENIDMKLIGGFREQAKKLYNETPYVIGGEHPVYGIMELGCWMCGFDNFLYRMAAEPEFALKIFDKILEYQKQVIELYYGAIGDYIHFTTSGDDFGTQTGPFLSPAMFRDLVKPYYKERISYTKKFTKAYFFHHTCGSVFDLIPHLVDAGVDILNPVQPGAKDMEPEKLKKAYGDAITFWGGIDTQHVLPHGKQEDIRKEVHGVLDAMARDGGYVLAPAHNIQADVAPENIVAIYESGKSYFARKVNL